MEQEEDHVVLGEELRDRRQLVGADLRLGLVDLVLLVRLPELIDPAEAVVGLEHRARQTLQQVLQLRARFRRQRDLEHRIVLAEDLRQHPLGVVARELQPVRRLLAGEFLHLVERDRHARLRLDQQIGLGQEAREQHAVPVLVGAFLNEPSGRLRSRLRVAPVAELPAMRAQSSCGARAGPASDASAHRRRRRQAARPPCARRPRRRDAPA